MTIESKVDTHIGAREVVLLRDAVNGWRNGEVSALVIEFNHLIKIDRQFYNLIFVQDASKNRRRIKVRDAVALNWLTSING